MATLTTLHAASPLNASDDTRLSFTQDITESLTRALDNVDTDFQSMDTGLTFNVEYSLLNASGGDTYALSIRIINGATILAAASAGGTAQTVSANVTNTTDTTSGAIGFTYVNTTATKTDWDGASVELTQTYTQDKGKDGNNIRVDFVTFDGTYTQAAANFPITADQQSYTLTTQTANVVADRTIAASQQSYTLTGQNAVFTKRDIVATQQSYTVTGQTANLIKGYAVIAAQASYTVTGPNAGLTTENLLYLRPSTDKSIGSWTDQVGGTTNIYTAIDESSPANDADYIKSETNPSASVYQADLTNPTGVPDTSGTHTVSYRYGKPSAGTQRIDITVRLREGAGTIASWTHTDVAAGWTDAAQVLTSPQVASITSYDNVYVEFEANQVV